MLSAKEAAAKTAMGKVSLIHGNELREIEKRITGATAAGLASVEVVFTGNAFDETTAELVKQTLLDEGYQVKLTPENKLGNLSGWRFNISW